MLRRAFLTAGASLIACPFGAGAQTSERVRRVSLLFDTPQDARGNPRLAALVQGLADLGWNDGRNLRLDIRWGANTPEKSRKLADELLALGPDVVLTSGSPATAAMRQATTTTPIVFTLVTDPVGAGFVDSLARPGTNLTGFTLFEYSIGTKWLELLKEIDPRIARVAVVRDVNLAAGSGQFGAIQSVASSQGVELRPVSVNDPAELARALAAFSLGSNEGMIVTASPLISLYREQIISTAAKHRLPAVYPYRHFVASGGLMSYGPDLTTPFRRAASYLSRILGGEKPSELPVQAPTTYDLSINLRTAKTLGVDVTPSLMARADEIIE